MPIDVIIAAIQDMKPHNLSIHATAYQRRVISALHLSGGNPHFTRLPNTVE